MADQGVRVDIYELDPDWRAEVWRVSPGFWPSERVYTEAVWGGQFATWQAAAKAAAHALTTLAGV